MADFNWNFAANAPNIGKITKRVDALTKSMEKLLRLPNLFIFSAKINLNEQTEQIKDLLKAIQLLSKQRKEVTFKTNIVTEETATKIDKVEKSVKKLAETQKRVQAETKKTANSFKVMGGTLTRLAGVWNTWNKAIDFGAKRLRQLVGVFTKFKDVAGTFERAEAEFRAFAVGAGASADEIEKLIQQSKELGRTTEFTATQALKAGVTMVKAGSDITTALRDQEASLKGAAAAGIDVGKAYSIGNKVVKIFGDEISDVSTALKIQVATSQAANTNISQLDQAMKTGGATAVNLGLSFTRFNAALALMAEKGFTGSQAARMLTKGFERLVNGTIPAKKALDELGVTAVDSQGNIRDMGSVFEDLKNSLSDETPAKRVTLLKQLFGLSAKAMSSLVNEGVSGFDAMEKKIKGAVDTMDRLVEFKENTIVGAFKKLQSAVEGVWLSFLNLTTLPLQNFLTGLATILNEISRRVENLEGQDIGSFFEGLTEALAPELQALENILQQAATKIGEFLGKAIDFFVNTDAFKKALNGAREFGHSIGKAIADGIKESLGETKIGKVLESTLLHEDIRDSDASTGGGFQKRLQADIDAAKKEADTDDKTSPTATSLRQLTEDVVADRIPVVEQEVVLEKEKNLELEKGLEAQELVAQAQKEIVTLEEKQLGNQIAIVQGQKEQATLTDEIALSQSNLTMGLNEYAANFKKAMLEPWDAFKSRLLDVKNKFGEMISGLKGTKIDILERVGLITEEGAVEKRAELQREQFKSTKKRLELAQSPAEKAALQESLAEQAAKLSEQSDEGEGGAFAKQAKEFIDSALQSRREQQAIEEEKIAIDKQLAEDNVDTLAKSLPQAQTAQEQVNILEQLDSSLQQLGRVDESAELQAQLQEAQRQASGESVELLKLMLEQLTLANEQRVKKSDEQTKELKMLREEQSAPGVDPYLQAEYA